MKIMIIFIKSYNFSSYILFFILFLFRSSISLIDIPNYIIETIQLENGNILLISDTYFYIVDPTFSRIINQTNYCCSYICVNNRIVHFSNEDGGYVLFKGCNYIDIFSKDGYFLLRLNNDYHYISSFIPYGHEENNSFFYEIYSESSNIIYFKKYAYNSISNNIALIKNNLIEINYNYYTTCQLIEYLNKNVTSCFFQTIYNDNYYINVTFFDIENNFSIINNISMYINSDSPLIYCRSTKMIEGGKGKILAVFMKENYNYIYIGYNNNTGELISQNININRVYEYII